MDVVGWIIASEQFRSRAADGVADEIQRQNLPVEFLATEQPRQRKIQNQIQQRVVNLCRMQRCAVGFVADGKVDGPGQIAGAAVACLLYTSDAADE